MATDLLSVVETGYDLRLDHLEWLTRLGGLIADQLELDAVNVACFPFDSPSALPELVNVGPTPWAAPMLIRTAVSLSPDVHDVLSGLRRVGLFTGAQIVGPETRNWRFIEGMLRGAGQQDAAVVLAHDGARTVAFAHFGAASKVQDIRQVRRWTAVATHLAAASRLRRNISELPYPPDAATAVIEPGGRVIDLKHASVSSLRERLRFAVRQIDRARCTANRAQPEALGLWQGLVEGRWSLVDHFDSDGRRLVLAMENAPEVIALKTLSVRQTQVAGQAALGLSNAEIGYALGISESSAASHLGQAARRLGVRDRLELVRLFSVARREPEERTAVPGAEGLFLWATDLAGALLSKLTLAEQQIASDIAQGLSNRQIALGRGRALRTVANQVASIFRKSGVASRAELLTKW
ncbi:MAG: helix-turn-helix transcriptional regulator [Polyangiaceae bacterium]